jgi:hypothetical protein
MKQWRVEVEDSQDIRLDYYDRLNSVLKPYETALTDDVRDLNSADILGVCGQMIL